MKVSSVQAPRRRSGRVMKAPDRYTPEAWPELRQDDHAYTASIPNEIAIDTSNRSADKDAADALLSASANKDLQGSDNTQEEIEVLDTFTLFEDLPKEIRLMIWELAIPERIINLCVRRYAREYKDGQSYLAFRPSGVRTEKAPDNILFDYFVYSIKSGLATLFVNKESRELTLKVKKEYLQYERGEKIYFNPKVDTIFIDTPSLWNLGHMIKWGLSVNRRCQGYLHGFDKIEALATESYYAACIRSLRSPTPWKDNNPPLLPNLRLWVHGMPSHTGYRMTWEYVVNDLKGDLRTYKWLRKQGGVRAIEELKNHFNWAKENYPTKKSKLLPRIEKKKYAECGSHKSGYLVRRMVK